MVSQCECMGGEDPCAQADIYLPSAVLSRLASPLMGTPSGASRTCTCTTTSTTLECSIYSRGIRPAVFCFRNVLHHHHHLHHYHRQHHLHHHQRVSHQWNEYDHNFRSSRIDHCSSTSAGKLSLTCSPALVSSSNSTGQQQQPTSEQSETVSSVASVMSFPPVITSTYGQCQASLHRPSSSSLSLLASICQPLAVMAPSSCFLWLPRVYPHFFIWLLLWVCLSSGSADGSPSQHRHFQSFGSFPSISAVSFIKRSPRTDDSTPYMKPSQFFNRYFFCRYELKQPNRPIIEDILESVPDGEEDTTGTITNPIDKPPQVWQQASTSSTTNSTTWRHSKRQNRIRKKQKLSCPVECDGITKWPETSATSVQQISCLDVLNSFRAMPSIMSAEVEMSSGAGQLDVDADGTEETTQSDINKVDSSLDEPVSIESYMLSEKKLASANATRRCSVDGVWELQADYSKCGLESSRLFVLTPHQLDKIYDMREKMINSRYIKLDQTEQAFVGCVDNVLSQPPSRLPEPFCERTFDGWTCFNDTPASHVVYFKCPNFIYGFNPQNEAHKTCTLDGKWKVHLETQVPWTNYTSCVDIPDFHFRNMIIKLHIIGYSISLLALLISLVIFFAFKTMSSQTRIRIHKNFFVSFIINNFMWIIWYFAITDQNMLFENGLYCQALHVLLHYFLVCNYFWMFCEGLYLHTILVVAFVSEEKILKWFYLIGWGIPILFASAYAILRANSPETQNCWIDESKYTWILNVPVLLSFVLNIFFLINIVRVLVTKLQAVNTADTHQTRKAVRATLILIPLLGLHFILTPFRPESNSSAAQAYEVFSAVVSSLQGFCVAMLFCFFNGEVLSHIRKRWNQFLLVHGYGSNRRMSYGGTTVSIRLSNYNLNSGHVGTNQSSVNHVSPINTNGNSTSNGANGSNNNNNNIEDDDYHWKSPNDNHMVSNNHADDKLHYEHLIQKMNTSNIAVTVRRHWPRLTHRPNPSCLVMGLSTHAIFTGHRRDSIRSNRRGSSVSTANRKKSSILPNTSTNSLSAGQSSPTISTTELPPNGYMPITSSTKTVPVDSWTELSECSKPQSDDHRDETSTANSQQNILKFWNSKKWRHNDNGNSHRTGISNGLLTSGRQTRMPNCNNNINNNNKDTDETEAMLAV